MVAVATPLQKEALRVRNLAKLLRSGFAVQNGSYKSKGRKVLTYRLTTHGDLATLYLKTEDADSLIAEAEAMELEPVDAVDSAEETDDPAVAEIQAAIVRLMRKLPPVRPAKP